MRSLTRSLTGPVTGGAALALTALALALACTMPAPASAAAYTARARFTARLHAPNHSPVAGRRWWITVDVRRGRSRLSGSVRYEFLYNGTVVRHVRGHRFRHGFYRDWLVFPREAVGYPLTLRIVVRTRYGTVNLNWAVKTRR